MRFEYYRVLFFSICLGVGLASCSGVEENRISTNGPEVVEFKVLPFDLKDVKLLDGPFEKAMELNVQSLLNYEPDRLLAKFRIEAGLKPKAKHYDGWEANTIAGHSLGHYLSACALMYNSTNDKRFLDRVNYIVDQLEVCQNADGEGYIGAFPDGKRILEEEVAKGDIRSKGFDLNGIWVPYYTEHKVMAGLTDAYNLCGNKKALQINIKFADWLSTIVKDLNDKQIQNMLDCEHGGINESLVDLYGLTKNEKYLQLSKVFHHKKVLDSLAHHVDVLPGIHANTQIPKLVGCARRYELTGALSDRESAEFFWDRVVHHHSYVTGGNCNHEYFGESDHLRNRLSQNTTETCNVYNMLKLSRHLFEWEAAPEVADFYERALFNHILSSQHPADGRVIYNLSLEMGGHKVYQDPYWFTCCVGTGMENHSKYGANIYFHNNNELYVTQFIGSQLNWKSKGLIVKQTTAFPEEQGTKLEFYCEKPSKFALKLRYPKWAENGVEIYINNEKISVDQKPQSFISIERKWKKGDVLEYKMPFTLRLETMPDDSNRVAVMYGPMVMAGELGPEDDPKANDAMYVPVIMTEDRDPSNWLSAVKGEANTFKTDSVGYLHDFVLKPFYKVHDVRYSVYFDVFNQESWAKYQKEYQAKQAQKKKLEEMTVDFFQPGEMQPERDHNFQSEKSSVDVIKNKRSRVVDRGGVMSFEMGLMKGNRLALAVEYWGGNTGAKTFDILIDGKLLATENIADKKPGEFIDILYQLPDDICMTKDKVMVTFKPHEGHRAGPVFGVRTVKQ
ncbi:beta-L-arabinofuranosidase domain-containing protein [Labilibaculum sp.]|uniref:beta-L-arabinofuranosidase domain-containing protein n=1 Tax=Labilibaculum sp. TaxID=2060723 RepID=UPI002AA79E82|nr:beta-L-arabinofuranosidase domain-containing protein [Labilibaculum sp.]